MSKYIVLRGDAGNPIPENEPCFVIRAQDVFALRILRQYIKLTRLIVDEKVTNELLAHYKRIRDWQRTHPIKIPD